MLPVGRRRRGTDMARIFIACGGTGGHFFPGSAVAECLLKRGHEVRILLCGKDVERSLLDWNGSEIVTVRSSPLSASPYRIPAAVLTNLTALARSLLMLSNADVVVGMGGYGAAPPLAAARLRRVPIVLFEANAVPGRVTRLLASNASAIALGMPECEPFLRKRVRKTCLLEVTGVPVRSALVQAAESVTRPESGGDGDKDKRVLVFGGSRGARFLNETVAQALAQLKKSGVDVQVDHVSGAGAVEIVRSRYAEAGITCEVMEYTPEMARLYRRATCAVTRAGASTCAELALFGLPALLIPYPFAAGDHQAQNAAALAADGAAVVCRQESADVRTVAEQVRRLLTDAQLRERMSRAVRKRARADAAWRVADMVEAVLGLTPAASSERGMG